MAVHEHEDRIPDRDGSPGIVAAVAVVALLVLAFFLFFSWNGGTVAVDVPAISDDASPGS